MATVGRLLVMIESCWSDACDDCAHEDWLL